MVVTRRDQSPSLTHTAIPAGHPSSWVPSIDDNELRRVVTTVHRLSSPLTNLLPSAHPNAQQHGTDLWFISAIVSIHRRKMIGGS